MINIKISKIPTIPTTTLFSVPISITSKERVLAVVSRWVMEGRRMKDEGRGKTQNSPPLLSLVPHPLSLTPRIMVTPNPEIIVAAQKNQKLLEALQHADLSIADGWGTAIALRVLKGRGKRLSSRGHSTDFPRIAGIDLMEALTQKAAQAGWNVMLIGGKEGIAEKAAIQLHRNFQLSTFNFQLLGKRGPSDIFHCAPEEMNELVIAINRFKPDLLFVAFGPGRQEVWMEQWRSRLNVGVMMGVGGALDQIVDTSLRPPHMIDSIGLGWAYRLIREPGRWKRQLALVTFILMSTTEVMKLTSHTK